MTNIVLFGKIDRTTEKPPLTSSMLSRRTNHRVTNGNLVQTTRQVRTTNAVRNALVSDRTRRQFSMKSCPNDGWFDFYQQKQRFLYKKCVSRCILQPFCSNIYSKFDNDVLLIKKLQISTKMSTKSCLYKKGTFGFYKS